MENIARTTGKRVLAGIAIVIAGILLLLSNMGFFDYNIGHLIFSWPGILIFIGVIIMISSNFRSGFLLAGIGAIFLIGKFYYLDIWTLWPAFLVLIGINILLHARHSPKHCEWKHSRDEWKESSEEWKQSMNDWKESLDDWKRSTRDWNPPSPPHPHFHHHHHHHWNQQEVNSDFIDESETFSGSRKIITSSNFKGGKVSAFFGGAEIDLSGCTLAPGNNIIDIDAVFGGITLYVPDNWKVVLQVTSVFGGFSDERRKPFIQSTETDRALIIRGRAIFGGGKIISA